MAKPFGEGLYAILDADRLGWRLTAHGLAIATETHGEAADDVVLAYARAAVAAGAVAVQLRAKGQSVPLALARALRHATGDVPFFINDDLDIATILARDGPAYLHLGQDDAAIDMARLRLGAGACLGLSTHTLGQVRAAADQPVDYLGFGPIHATDSKRGASAVTGLAGLAAAVAATRLPVVAIGGLTAADLPQIRATGAHAAAVIGAWLGPVGAPHGAQRAGEALAALVDAWQVRAG